MTRVLYDLAGAEDDRRFSPYCWRARMALAHKGLAVETVPWRFTDKETIAFSGQDKVPVLVDDGHVVHDSWAIATYLDATYPDAPTLFPGGTGTARFVANWADAVVHAGLVRMIVGDVHARLHPRDHDYFRTSREQRFGMALEAVGTDRDARVVTFREALHPLRMTLRTQPFITGATPGYADYAVFGAFQWARCTSPFPLLLADDPVFAWRDRLLDVFDGLARRAPGYAC